MAAIKKGAMHKQLGIPMSKKISKQLIDKLANGIEGKKYKNPSVFGKKVIKLTPKLKKRAQFVASVMK